MAEQIAPASPLPWLADNGELISGEGVWIGIVPIAETASHIVHCVNTYPELLSALRKLANEVSGMLGIIEPEMRQAAGHTNVNVLALRLAEARETIARAEGAEG